MCLYFNKSHHLLHDEVQSFSKHALISDGYLSQFADQPLYTGLAIQGKHVGQKIFNAGVKIELIVLESPTGCNTRIVRISKDSNGYF
jgi:hypothetical protein